MKQIIVIGLLALAACAKQVSPLPVGIASIPPMPKPAAVPTVVEVTPALITDTGVCVNLRELLLQQQEIHNLAAQVTDDKKVIDKEVKKLDLIVAKTKRKLKRDGIHCD